MSDELIKEVSPLMTPDSLRATLKFLKRFNDSHTKKYHEYEDIEGSKYVGTTENFGDELLIESRKLLMDKPSLKRLFSVNTFTEYFDIDYSDLIDTYSQENMLVAILKTDALVSTKTYKIKYTGCEIDTVYRSMSWGSYNEYVDPVVGRDMFYKTSTPPVLEITNTLVPELDPVEIPLKLKMDDFSNTYYLAHYDTTTADLFDATPTQGEDGKYSFTMTLDKGKVGLSFVWIVVDAFLTRPDVDMTYTNIGVSNLSAPYALGTDGQNITKVFPYMYETCLPEGEDPKDWYINAYSKGNNFDMDDDERNLTVQLSKVEIVKNAGSETKIIRMTYDTDVAKFKLNDRGWRIVEGDDGILFAQLLLSHFQNNADETKNPVAAFLVSFDDVTLPYEGDRNNAVSGIHVDAGTDYTNHSILKDNGIIHSLEQFGGLPSYFNYLLARDIHRSHVEVYSIRDRLHRINERVYEKQTAGLILDSAVPQKELPKLSKDVPVVIKYVSSTKKYETVSEPPSINNSLSEITYVDENNLGNASIFGQNKLPKFIYHGNRTFSTGTSELDPELEKGRVYIISNDPVTYSNNGSTESEYHRSPRTFARICDIPTDYGQLIHIKNVAPTILFDDKYVHSSTAYLKKDKNQLYNGLFSYFAYFDNNIGEFVKNTRKLIFKYTENLGAYLTYPYLKGIYTKYIKLSLPVSLSNSANYTFGITNPGSGYKVNDKFYFLIGGRAYDAVIDAVNGSGAVTEYHLTTVLTDLTIPQSNLNGRVTTFKTESSSTENGTGLTVSFTVSEAYWDVIQPAREDDVPEGLFAFKYDEFDNIWVYEFDVETHVWNKVVQLTGDPVNSNYYDINNPILRRNRMLGSTMMYNLLNSQNVIDETYANNPMCVNKTISDVKVVDSTVVLDHNYNKNRDNSDQMSRLDMNGGIYLTSEGTTATQMNVTMINYNIPHNGTENTNGVLLPALHDVNTKEYYNKSNKFMVSSNDSSQPSLILYSPSRGYMNKYPSIIHTENTVLTSGSYEISYYDAFLNDTDNTWIIRDGTTVSSIYEYNEFEPNSAYKDACDKVDDKPIETIKEVLISLFGENFDPVIWNSDVDTLREYAKQLIYAKSVDPVYKKNEIELKRKINDVVINKNNGKTIPVGNQQRGAYINVSQEEYDINVSTDKADGYGMPMYFFAVDDISSIPDTYRVTDEQGHDISAYSVLILDRVKYVFKNGAWKPIIGKSI